MKKIFLFAAVAALTACNSSTEKKDDAAGSMKSDSTKSDEIVYPYTTSFSITGLGDPKHSQTVLNIWKAWDSRDISSVKDSFADSLELHLSDGTTIKGSRDSILSVMKSFQDNFNSIVSSVNSVMSLKGMNSLNNQNEEYVAVWGTEVTTSKTGKMDSIWLHEVWRINKDGKTDYVSQFAQVIPKTSATKSK